MMLSRVDRIQLLVPDRDAAARYWTERLDARITGRGSIRHLTAVSTIMRLGDSWVELLEPDGAGDTADHLAARGPHLYAAGVATGDLDGLVTRLGNLGVKPEIEDGQAFLSPKETGIPGLRVVASQEERLTSGGMIDTIYEVTLITGDFRKAAERVFTLFGLNPDNAVSIKSDDYGYTGTLTLFNKDQLDRFEIITPNNEDKTLGRFHNKIGDSFYMAFAETGQIEEIRSNAIRSGAEHTAKPAIDGPEAPVLDSIFLHPSALGGTMLGISRRTLAWKWSGRPDLVAGVSND